MRYVGLLRGINVGKAKRVSMGELRALLSDLGHTEVATVLMSGNAVFTSSSRSPAALAKAIEKALASQLSLDVRVFVRPMAAVAKIADEAPWPSVANQDPSRLQISFHDGAVDRSVLASILSADWSPERFAVGKGATYAWHPNGMTGSKLAEAVLKVKGGAVGTVRNLATVRKILDRAESGS